jgi:hypothetical protein
MGSGTVNSGCRFRHQTRLRPNASCGIAKDPVRKYHATSRRSTCSPNTRSEQVRRTQAGESRLSLPPRVRTLNSTAATTLEKNEKFRLCGRLENAFVGASGGGDGTGIQPSLVEAHGRMRTKESYVEGVAAHNGPASRGVARKGGAEALTGKRRAGHEPRGVDRFKGRL